MQNTDYPRAYILVGRYVVTGSQVRITTKLRRKGTPIDTFTLTGECTQLAELVQQVVAIGQQQLTP